MENTTNYGLRKYQSGDLFNPLTVNNPNLDDIDTDMKAISDRAIGRATELVSQGVHAITLLDTDCKTFKFVATGNYSAGETFTVNGIQCNAYTPSGSALASNAFVTGSIVLGALNEDGTAITFYVTGSAVADDSLKLGGHLPSYYATQTDMTSANTDITNLKNQAGNTSIVGIGDGTLSGAVSSLNNDLNYTVYSATGNGVKTRAQIMQELKNAMIADGKTFRPHSFFSTTNDGNIAHQDHLGQFIYHDVTASNCSVVMYDFVNLKNYIAETIRNDIRDESNTIVANDSIWKLYI